MVRRRVASSLGSLQRLYARALGYQAAGDYDRARQYFLRSRLHDRNIAPPVPTTLPIVELLSTFHLGQIYEATGQRNQARTEYEALLSRVGNSADLRAEITEAGVAIKRLRP